MDKLEQVTAFFHRDILPVMSERFPDQVKDLVLVVGGSVAMGITDDFQDIDASLAVCQPVPRETLVGIRDIWQKTACDVKKLDRDKVDRYPDRMFDRMALLFFDDPSDPPPDPMAAAREAFYILSSIPLYDPGGHYRRLQARTKVWENRQAWHKVVRSRWCETSMLVRNRMRAAVDAADASLFAQIFSRANLYELCIILCRQPLPIPKWQHYWLKSCPPLGPELHRLLGNDYDSAISLEDKYRILLRALSAIETHAVEEAAIDLTVCSAGLGGAVDRRRSGEPDAPTDADGPRR